MQSITVEHTQGDDKVGQAFAHTFGFVQQALERIISSLYEAKSSEEDGGMTCGDAIHLAVGGAVAATRQIALLIKKGDGSDINEDQFFYAILVVASSVAFTRDDVNKVDAIAIENGPRILLKAMNMFEQLTGRKPDQHLNPSMVNMVRSPKVKDEVDQYARSLN
jgi:hypothetical protein